MYSPLLLAPPVFSVYNSFYRMFPVWLWSPMPRSNTDTGCWGANCDCPLGWIWNPSIEECVELAAVEDEEEYEYEYDYYY